MTSTHLTVTVTLLVLVAGVLHAAWNAIAAAIKDKLVAFGLIGVTEAVIGAVALPFTGLPSTESMLFAGASSLLHVAYNFALLRAYRLGDFGQAYPLARGTSPLLVTAGAWFLASEHLGGLQLGGVALVAAGLGSIVFVGGRVTRADLPATAAALLTGCAIASYTVVDGLGVRHAGSAFGYIALLFVLQGPVMVGIVAMARRHELASFRAASLPAGVTAGALSMLAYGIVIWAQLHGPLALVSALRETSVISGALIATLLFHEPFGRRRLLPSVAVVAGILVISL